MQIVSITEDRDIQYQPIDIQRTLLNKFDDAPNGLYLIKTDNGNYFYGKEFSYALFASPFFAIFGNAGILFFNALLFWCMVLMGFFYLSKKGNSPLLSFFTSSLFFTLSTAVVYIFWIHAEIYNMFLITAGIYFWSLYIEDQKKNKYLLIAAFIFGLATVAKLPNCLVFLPFLCYELYNRQWKRAVSMLLIFLIPFLLIYGFFYLETGSLSFYGGNRFYYVNLFPFTDGFDSANECGSPAFSVNEGNLGILFNTDVLTKSPYNLFYYFFGRFTGMIWYYPLTAFALLSFVLGMVYIKKQNNEHINIRSQIGKDPIRSLILTGIVLNILFYVIIIGNNYLGGGHAVGNRYFYIFPAFLFLVGKIDLKVLTPFVIIALFTVIPVIVHPIDNSQLPETHTFRFPYTIFPVEYSQIDNLPLWTHQYTFPDYTLYDIKGNSFFIRDGIVVNGTSHWLIKIQTTNQNFTVKMYSTHQGKKQVTIISESHVTNTIIEDTGAEIVTIPLSHTVYEDSGYKIYSIFLKSSSDVFIVPLSDKIQN